MEILGLTMGSGVTMMTMAVALTLTITDPTTEDLVIMTTLGAGLIMTTTALTMDGETMTADLPTEITAQTTVAGGVTTAHLSKLADDSCYLCLFTALFPS